MEKAERELLLNYPTQKDNMGSRYPLTAFAITNRQSPENEAYTPTMQ